MINTSDDFTTIKELKRADEQNFERTNISNRESRFHI